MAKSTNKMLEKAFIRLRLTKEESNEILGSSGYSRFLKYKTKNRFIPFFEVYRSLEHFGKINSEIDGCKGNETNESAGLFLLNKYMSDDNDYWAMKLKSGRIIVAYLGN